MLITTINMNINIFVNIKYYTYIIYYSVCRLSNVFVQDKSSRVKCSEVIAELINVFEGISKRECSFVIRKRFPNVKRIHSSHVYYYTGIRRLIASPLTTAENSTLPDAKDQGN